MLQPRERGGPYETYEAWAPVEAQLRAILGRAAEAIDLPEEERLKYWASATHQEIVAGALQVEDAGEHVFCFLRQIEDLFPNRRAGDFVDLDGHERADLEARAHLDQLKRQLCEALPAASIRRYSAPWTLRGISTEHLDQLCEDVFACLSRVILEQVGKLTSIDPLEGEIAAHQAFAEDRSRHFVGRAAILDTIDDYLSNRGQHPLVIWGEGGTGKSALLAQAMQQARENHADARVVYRFIGATSDSSNGRALLEGLCRQVYRDCAFDEQKQHRLGEISSDDRQGEAKRTAIEREYAIPPDLQGLSTAFPRLLGMVPADRRLVLFLDALDQLSPEDRARDLTWLPVELPQQVHIVVSSLPGHCLDALRARILERSFLELHPLTAEEGVRLLDLWLAQAGRCLQTDQRREVLARFAACGLPLFLKLVFEEARRWQSWDEVPGGPGRGPGLGRRVQDMITRLFSRLSRDTDHGEALVSRSLGHLGAARHGLTEDEIIDVLSRDDAVMGDYVRRSSQWSPDVDRLPVIIWSRLYADLEPYLAGRQADGTVVLSFHHRQIAEAAQFAFLSGEEGPARHRALAHYFASQPLTLGRDALETPNRRKLSEQAYQQTRGALWEDLERTLCDLRLVEAKCAAGGTFDLVADYTAALRVLPEALEEQRSGLKHEQRMCKYAEDLVAFAQGKIRSLDVVRSVALWDDERIRREERRISERPTRLDRIRAFAQFASRESHNLATFGAEQRFCAQQAHNLARSGPVVEAADAILRGETERALLLRHPDRRSASEPYPALVRTLEGHAKAVGAVAITPDGRRAVSRAGPAGWIGHSEATVYVWDVESGECLRQLEAGAGAVTAVALTPDGRRAVVGGEDGALRIWDLDGGRCLRTVAVHERAVTALAISADGSRAIVGCPPPPREPGRRRAPSSEGRPELLVWDLEAGKLLRRLEASASADVNTESSVAITADGLRAVTLDGKALRVWDLESGTCLHTLEGHIAPVWSVSITPDGRRAITGFGSTGLTERNRERALRVWDLEAGECVSVLQGPFFSPYIEVSITPDGRRAVSGGTHDALKVWRLDSGECVKTFGPSTPISCLAISADGRRAITGSGRALQVWDLQRGVTSDLPDEQTAGPQDDASSVGWHDAALVWDQVHAAVTPDGTKAALAGGDAKTFLHVWDLRARRRTRRMESHTGSTLSSVAMTPCGSRALAGSADSSLQFWDLETGKCTGLESPHHDKVASVCVSPDGRTAVSAPSETPGKPIDRTLWVWDLGTGKPITSVSLAWDAALSVRVTPDGRCALAGGLVDSLRLWDLRVRKSVRELKGHPWWTFRCARVTPDGRRAVSAASDAVRLWDLREGSLLRTMPGSAEHLGLTPDGRYAVAVGEVVAIWDLDRGDRIAVFAGTSNGGVIVPAEGTCPYAGAPVGPGALDFLTAYNLRLGPAIVTPVRLWLQGKRAWDRRLTAACPWCGHRFPVAQSVLGTIRAMALNARLSADQVPCLDLPLGAWDESRLSFDCPQCSRELRANPFVVDNRAAAVPRRVPGRTVVTPTQAVRRGDGGRQGDDRRQTADDGGAHARAVRQKDGGRQTADDGGAPTRVVRQEGHGRQGDDRRRTADDGRQTADGRVVPTRATRRVPPTTARPRAEPGQPHPVAGLAVTADGTCAAAGLADGGVHVIDLGTGALRYDLRVHGAVVEAVAFAADGTQLVTASRDGAIGVWDLRNGQLLRRIRTGEAPGALALTPDGMKAVFVFDGHTIHVWDTVAPRRLRRFSLKGSPVHTLATSADANRLAIGCQDGQLLFVDLAKAAVTVTVKCKARVRALALDAAGELAFFAVGDRTIRVWDTLREAQLSSLPREVAPVVAMAASGDGQRLVSVTKLTLSAFDVMRATRVSLQTNPKGWSACAVSRDGLLAVGGGPDGRVETFRVPRARGRGGAGGGPSRWSPGLPTRRGRR